ncbi:DUF6629 family protein [Mesorhizobium sp. KR9-304]|uniref:DUF6629 family protein n=1 Tax=Mesorhizobium sp. KR9-304 TaxID=3156614 RepID=UPI0032B50196
MGERSAMCFSATASFITMGLTGAMGIAALRRSNTWQELPIASAPIFFAIQQGLEGLLWLNLPVDPQGSISTWLTFLFLIAAEAFWPIYVPVATLLIEPNEGRRRLILACLAAGIAVGAYLLWDIVRSPHGAVIQAGHIVYVNVTNHGVVVALAYLAATALPLMLSTRPMVAALGVIVLVGSAIAFAFYWEAFVSVWCFFAAAASIVLVLYFETSYRKRILVTSIGN